MRSTANIFNLILPPLRGRKATVTLALLALSTLNPQLSTVLAQGSTAFTYQGRLNDGGVPANGSYDLKFSLFSVASGGTAFAGPLLNSATAVSNGLFTVALDFGSGVFTGTPCWLDIAVRTNGGGAFTTLSPRQALTPAPYALMANSASNLLGTLPAAQLSGTVGNSQLPPGVVTNGATGVALAGTFSGNGAGLTGVVPANGSVGTSQIVAGSVSTAVIADGAVTTSKIAPGSVVTSLDGLTDAVTLTAGANANLQIAGNTLTISAVPTAVVTNAGWGVVGNSGTTAGSNFLGTLDNQPLELKVARQRALRLEPTLLGLPNVIGGTSNNLVLGAYGVAIGGGNSNTVQAGVSYGTIAGGYSNTLAANASYAVIPGGSFNTAGAPSTFAAGTHAKALNSGAFVWADATGPDFASTANNQFLIRAAGGVGINMNTPPSGALQVNGNVGATSFSGSGSGLSGLNAANISSGTLPDARLSTNAPLLNRDQAFSGSNTFSGVVAATNANNNFAGVFTGSFFGNFTGTTNAGTPDDVPNTLVQRNGSGSFSAGTVTATGFSGDGSSLTGLNASVLASGTVPDARLSANAALLNGTNTFTGTNAFAASLIATNPANQIAGVFTGDGAGLTNIPSAQLPAGVLTNDQNGVVLSGTFSGNGAGLTNLGGGTPADTPGALVQRDGGGSFSAMNVTLEGNLNLPATTTNSGLICAGGGLLLHGDTNQNFFVGPGAGNLTVSGHYNVGVGVNALPSDTTGFENTAGGFNALGANTSGYDNTALGAEALYFNTSGIDNTALGADALYYNTSGSLNTAVGSAALIANTTGGNNTASGFNALGANRSGSGNTANGHQALLNNTNGNNNIALGFEAGYNLTAGNYNLDIGNPGTAGDNGVIRIGTTTAHTNTFIAGIYGAIASNGAVVFVNAAGQLGTAGTVALAQLPAGVVTNGASGVLLTGTFAGNGIGLTNLNPANLAAGTANVSISGNAATVNNGVYTSGSYADPAWLTSLAASKVSGTLPDGNLSANVALLNTNQAFTGSNRFAGVVTLTNTANTLAGNGAGLTNLNAASLTGVLPLAQLPAALLTNHQTGVVLTGTFSGDGAGLTNVGQAQLPAGVLTNNQSGVTLTGSFSGDGAGLTNLNPANLAAGTANISISGNAGTATSAAYAGLAAMAYTAITATTATNLVGNVPDAQLSANIARLNGANSFTGTNTFAGVTVATNVNNIIAGSFIGDGAGLTNLSGGSSLVYADTNSNFFAGPGAGNLTMTGSWNTGVGSMALSNNASGSANTANGYWALQANTTGGANTANGHSALYANTDGAANTASGVQALCRNTSGNWNTANGDQALFLNTTGSGNIALGAKAGYNLTSGDNNIYIGNQGVSSESGTIRIGTPGTHTGTVLAGDLQISGAYKGTIGPNGGAPFPRPAYDSGWVAINHDQVITLTHNIGGNTDNYVVDMQFKGASVGVNQVGYGGDASDAGQYGAVWYGLTASQIGLHRSLNDTVADSIRIRIWVYN